jgi:S1-C subfamily serine protease
VNWIDVLILASLAFAVLSGFRRGAIMQIFGWGGLLLGLIVGAALAPPIVKHLIRPKQDQIPWYTLGIFLGVAFLTEGLLAAVGYKVRRKITNPGARHADAVVGVLIAAFFSLATSWFMGYQLSRVHAAELSRAIHKSKILSWEDRIAPRPPGFLATIGHLLDSTGFPQVFAQLNPSLAPGVSPPPASLAKDPAILKAADATYKIESAGCGGLVDGSGFPLDRVTVITAAHVVAGTHSHFVIDPNGNKVAAVVVYFDPNKDISVLKVTGALRTLVLDADIAPRGTDGAAIGYPGGGPRTISVARVRTEVTARGFNIYNNGQVTRDVYVLAAHVRQGNSGGPFVDTQGRVRGMVFAASTDNPDESYALAGDEVATAYSRGRGRSSAVSTGSECAV